MAANLASMGLLALFAAESTPAFNWKNLGPILPFVIGGGFALAVILMGLILSRKGSVRSLPSKDGVAGEQQLEIYLAPNPLWKVVLPCSTVLGVGALIYFVYIPYCMDLPEVGQNLHQPIYVNNPVPPVHPALQFQQNAQLPTVPTPINMQSFQPHIHIPQVYVDSQGIVRAR